MLRGSWDLKGVVIALIFQELSGDASKFRERELMALVQMILKQGGGVPSGDFQFQNIALKVALAAGISCTRRWAGAYRSPMNCRSQLMFDAVFNTVFQNWKDISEREIERDTNWLVLPFKTGEERAVRHRKPAVSDFSPVLSFPWVFVEYSVQSIVEPSCVALIWAFRLCGLKNLTVRISWTK